MAKAWAELPSGSVLELVETVQRLSDDDQERMLRMVTLLAQAPHGVQRTTQHMLRQLIDSGPKSASECISGIEAAIEYLEASADPLRSPAAFDLLATAVSERYSRYN